MQLEIYKTELESKISLLQNGFMPSFSGPSFLHGMWAKQREREYEGKLEDTNKRIDNWKPPKKPKCAGPSCFDVVLARFGGDFAFYGMIGAVILTFLWYVGLLGPLWWIVTHFVWLIKSVVYFFSNLHKLVRSIAHSDNLFF